MDELRATYNKLYYMSMHGDEYGPYTVDVAEQIHYALGHIEDAIDIYKKETAEDYYTG
jgi:hypothetical protein